MKTLLNIVLGMVLSLGMYASPTKSKKKVYSVEILNVSPVFKQNEEGKLEVNNTFSINHNDFSEERFGTFWAEFEIEEGASGDVYETGNWKMNDIRLAKDLAPEEMELIKDAFYQELEIVYNKLPKSSVDAILNASDTPTGDGFNDEAPAIIYANLPSALVIIDGEPYYEELDKRYTKISNAGAFMVRDNKSDTYYMYGGGLWFSSVNALHGWEYTDKVPNRINRVMRKHARELYNSMQNEQFQSRIVPDIIVSTEPSELISTDGSPKYVLIENTGLVFVENTDAELFRDLNTSHFYALFSGRWFVSDKLEGNWQYVVPGELPTDFAKIPESHEKSNVLVSVPGTKAAEDAVKNAQIPHVRKKDVSAELDTWVEYNGNPEFVAIEGTRLSYAVNTSRPVIMWNNNYYLVDEAVWYHSTSPYGPWQVATQRPLGVENIPADNPLYNIKYVHIYKKTDRVVYTGYTSGYTGSYVYGPTVVFGTGFHYHGWHGRFYYHHPMTYGYGFFYDPFYGWIPVYSPWYRSSFYWHWHWGYWYGYRPPYYRPPYYRPPSGVHPEQPIHRPGRPVNLPTDPGSVRPSQPSTLPSQPNVRPIRPATRPSQPVVRPTQPINRPSRPAVRPSQPSIRPTQPATRPASGPVQMR